ncbi:MAG: prephenate dehydrogenase/arogenate dehydrogenase family protein [Candidatus Omnitrophica bacterium]|nr:prephenate dehydrogenase/arogenate dehydrogenase family protein [Candidatus Omnitrophota bacterium]
MKLKFNKAVIVGPGLIGGSIGMILRQKKIAASVVGVARKDKTLTVARRRGLIDYGTKDVKRAIRGADLIVLALPVDAIKKTIKLIGRYVQSGCLIFDVGSTKREILKAAAKMLPKKVYFVGTHPMAGSEKSGPAHANSGIFKKSLCFVVMSDTTNRCALKKVVKLWKFFGARVELISAAKHDRIVAQMSHLPHLISAALVESVEKKNLKFAATGFKDTTRIAAADSVMWQSIFFSNRKEILGAIKIFESRLKKFKNDLEQNRIRNSKKQLERARNKRETVV